MRTDVVIKVENVSKKFCKSLKRSMVYGASDIMRNAVGLNAPCEQLRDGEFWAVNDVSFEVKRGETLGLIGSNGSGKTTLLKMLNGIFWPDRGEISIRGRVGALIAVGAGFHPVLTGRENIYVNGAILGMTKQELDKKFDAIVEFADIGDFLDTPVKYYSSGMFVRLGFAVAVHCEPDILLVDEVLAVGDINFQKKCLDKISEFKKEQRSVILVTHNLLQVEMSCQRCLLMDHGVVRSLGTTKDVLSRYVDEANRVSADNAQGSSANKISGLDFGTNEVVIERVRLVDTKSSDTGSFYPYDDVKVIIDYYAKNRIIKPNFIITVNLLGALRVLVSNTKVENVSPEYIEGRGSVECIFPKVPLLPHQYNVDVYIKDDEHGIFFDVRKNAASFSIKVPVNQELSYRVSGDMGIVPTKGTWFYGK